MTKTQSWTYFNPTFEYKSDFDDHNWPWAGHIYWAYDLIRNIHPKTVVELGTHKGTSFFSFCQAAKDISLKNEIFAVDTWEGDEQAGFYGQEIYDAVVSITRRFYIEQNTRLLKMTFDEALNKFADKSIDLLHIDGLHTYEAVKHDYDSWKGKVKDDGIIMFHDIKVPDFGVWEVWKEVKEDNKDAIIIEFEHNFGLGVVIKDQQLKQIFTEEFISHIIEYYKKSAGFHIHKEETKSLESRINNLEVIINSLTSERDNYFNMYNAASSELEGLKSHTNIIENDLKKEKNYVHSITTRKGFKVYNKVLKLLGKDFKF
ncbi:MAG: class I SAM-dependent methyltransferase [bacterium]